METIELGKSLFLAGNCAHCHTKDGGIVNAGGRPVETPFGTIYTTNLTPDPETGLGTWSFAAFERAMRHGISRDGSNLYPAFPYTSFAGMSEGDLIALYAYIQSLEPVRHETPKAQMIGPAALRPSNAFWNALYHDATPLQPDPMQDAAWNRGRYLVDTVAHCGACHTPRDLLGAEKKDTAYLAGAMINGWYAPPLVGSEAAQWGWTVETLTAYLQTGHADQIASAGGPMAEVASALSQIPAEDTQAMAVYLASLSEANDTDQLASNPTWQLNFAEVTPVHDPVLDGRTHRIFEASCATCHEPALAGILTAARLPLSLSTVVRAPTSENAEIVIRDGLRAPLHTNLRDMPGFGHELTDAQIKELAQYMRRRYAPDLEPW